MCRTITTTSYCPVVVKPTLCQQESLEVVFPSLVLQGSHRNTLHVDEHNSVSTYVCMRRFYSRWISFHRALYPEIFSLLFQARDFIIILTLRVTENCFFQLHSEYCKVGWIFPYENNHFLCNVVMPEFFGHIPWLYCSRCCKKKCLWISLYLRRFPVANNFIKHSFDRKCWEILPSWLNMKIYSLSGSFSLKMLY